MTDRVEVSMALLFTQKLRTCPDIFLFFAMIAFTPFWLMPILWSLFAPFVVELSLNSWTLFEEDPWICWWAVRAESGSAWIRAGIKPGVQAPWLFPQWFLCGMSLSGCSGWLKQSAGRVTGGWKKMRVINLKGLRLPEQCRQKPQKSEELEERGCCAAPVGSGRGHCPHSRQILCPSLFIQALPFALCFALQGLEKTSLQKYQEEYTGMYSEFKSFWN